MSLNTADTGVYRPNREARAGRMERAVPPAMLVVAIAMGVASHLHLGLTFELAAAVGLSLFCIMLLCHVLLRAADAADRAEEEAEERRLGEVASPIPVPALPPAPPMNAGPANISTPPAAHAPGAQPLPAAADAVGEPSAQANHACSAAPAGWEFRPVDIRPPAADAASAEAGPQATMSLGAAPVRASAPAAGSDHVDALLKRLAAQIRGGTSPPPSPAKAQPDLPAPAKAETPDETALDKAVGALRSTVEAMRTPEPVAKNELAPAALPAAVEARLAAVAEALAAERANIYLEPILQLAEDQARHFEVSVRLVDADGADLDARAFSARSGNAELLSLIDALALRHAAGFALKLERRGRDGSVFSEVAGHSLADDRFVADASGRHAQGIADRLVLTFQQSEMRALGPAQLAALGDLARLGFRFAIQGVSDLDMDFEALQGNGLHFVKLDAEVFLRGFVCGGEDVPASDICRFFEEIGLQVIVSGVDSDILRQRIVGCGVSFGQGLVFGEPRPIPVGMPAGGIAA